MKNLLVGLIVAVIVIAVFVVMTNISSADTLACAIKECPKELTITNNNQVLTYYVDRRFNVVLDRFKFPTTIFKCDGPNIIESTLSMRDMYPNQMERFVLKNAGQCQLTNGKFSVTILAVLRD